MKKREALAIKQAAQVELFALPGVKMVGLGFKWVAGTRTDITAIRVFVERKLSADEIPMAQVIPANFDALPTDVEELGEIGRLEGNPRVLDYGALDLMQRPLFPGVKMTNVRKEARLIPGPMPDTFTRTEDVAAWFGTLGCFVKTKASAALPNRICALTNHHVVNPSHASRSQEPGREIFQPEPLFDATGRPQADDESESDCWCGGETQQEKLRIGRVLLARNNAKVDAALVGLKGGLIYDQRLMDVNGALGAAGARIPIQGSRKKAAPNDDVFVIGEDVYKIGCRTLTTVGKVIDEQVHSDNDILDEFGIFREAPTGSFFIEPTGPTPEPGEKLRFDEGGDSGSALVAKSDSKVIGLVWGGRTFTSGPRNGMRLGIADPIDIIEEEMQCEVLAFDPGDPAPAVPSNNLDGVPHLDTNGEPVAARPSVGERAQEAARALRARPSSDRVQLLERHVSEVRDILYSNRQARIRWIREGGPTLAGICLDGVVRPESKLPSSTGGLSLARQAVPVLESFVGQGSASLDASIKSLLPLLQDSEFATFGELADAVLDSI